jgi:hypothetical protein
MADDNPIACPGCGASSMVATEIIGRRIRCMQCGARFTAVSISPTKEYAPEPEPFNFADYNQPETAQPQEIIVIEKPHKLKINSVVVTGSLAAMLTLGFVITTGKPPGPLVYLNYSALFAAIWLAIVSAYPVLMSHLTIERLAGLALIPAVLACAVYSQFDRYTDIWHRDGATFSDVTIRWTGNVIYRTATTQHMVIKAPMKGTPPKFHGHVIGTTFAPKFETIHGWFWYGEEVTQGDFELRSRQ